MDKDIKFETPQSCVGCSRLSSKECGIVKEWRDNASAQYIKDKDERCADK